MPPTRDPRDIITPAAFTVAPELLGAPLARPWRRAAAILVDLALCGILVGLIQVPSVFFGTIVAVLLFRLTRRPVPASSWMRRAIGITMRATLAIILFVVGIAAAQGIVDRFSADSGQEGEMPTGARLSLLGLGLTMADGAALSRASSAEEADAAARRIRGRFVASGLDPEDTHEIRLALESLEAEEDVPLSPIAIAALRRAFAELDSLAAAAPSDAAPVDGLANDSTAADSGAADPGAIDPLATDPRVTALSRENARLRESIEELRDQNGELRGRNGELRDRNEELKEALEDAGDSTTVTELIGILLDDLGLGFGWMMLYFTVFTASWRGHTPGKRLLRIRVIRLDGRPIGWWLAFERFGGYSAAIATGLLGFLQILWDRNRQAIHDKITETVVIDERLPRRSIGEQTTGGG